MATIQSITDCPPLPEITGIEFRHIPNLVGYAATSDGNVWSCRAGKIAVWRTLFVSINDRGYRRVLITKIGHKGSQRKVAVCVAEAFIGPRQEGLEVCHGERGKLIDTPDNLRWDTHAANMQDEVARGLTRHSFGETNPCARLSDAQAATIRRLRGKVSQTDMAILCGVAQTTISNVHIGLHYQEIPS